MNCINTHPLIDRPNGKPIPTIEAVIINGDMNGVFRFEVNFSTMNPFLKVHNIEGY